MRVPEWHRTSHALAAYFVLTLIATWPVVLGLARDVPWDLGDSVLNMWILSWDAEQFRAILQGDLSRVQSFFDANIFHPAPLTLAYSEHLIPQALQILPVYLLTDNPILCYNLLFLSTFVLSGLGMYLFVRELTGNGTAAFVAGLIFAFAPYRLPQSSHLQVISSQWMPFVLYGLRRYFDTQRLRPLAGAMCALVIQALSCGYYLLYFTPFALAYGLWEIWQRRAWRQPAMWLQLSAAGVLAAVLVAPFLLPYAAIRNDSDTARSIAEVRRYSADIYSYATAFSGQRVWGDLLQAFPKPEGELFPGAIPILLVAIGVTAAARARPRVAGAPAVVQRRWLTTGLALVAGMHVLAALVTLLQRRIVIDLGLFTLQMSNVTQLLLRAAIAFAVLLAVSPPARARAAAFMRSPGFFVCALVAAMWLSLGPAPQALGRPVELAAPYAALYNFVPGFEGVRVPARFAMIAMAMVAVLSGFGAVVVSRIRYGGALVAVLALAFLVEATLVPFQVNAVTPPRGYATPEPRVYRPARAPLVYREFAARAPEGVLVELPLGQADYDLRAMYYSIVHWRPLLNGYSGFFPAHYSLLRFALSEFPRDPDLAMQTLREGGATHAIVHEAAFLDGEGGLISAALRLWGAVELYRDGGDVLFALPR